ncbi:MAG: homoserine O-acetyltransferase, partial [Paludibacteraceae bacterium]|nr:homoserine O-acetyltransferase [Paludibacteraceae bacterium]
MQAHTLHISQPFQFEAGGTLPAIDIAYHTSGTYRPGQPVVWICHALTANSDAEDWWPEMVGPGRAIDTDRFFVACVNMLGSPYGSSGPAAIDPTTGQPYMLSFPRVTVRDIVRATILVRQHLGIPSVDLLVGSSIGGFQAVEWAVTEPEVITNALFIATGARVNAWTSATLEAQRMALEADPTFRQQHSLEGGKQGLRCARAQALLTYRSFEGYRLTQSEADIDTLFASRAASYERYQGDKLAARFDAYSYLSVIDSADSHNVGRHRGGVQAALAAIRANTTMVCITSDGLFPPDEMREWAQFIPGATYLEIESAFGHDGFLLETEALTRIIQQI